MRGFLARAVRVFVFIAIVEVLCLGFGVLSIRRGNAFLLYYPSLFTAMNNEQINREKTAPSTGWPKDTAPRKQPTHQATTCGAAMGGSFTYGDDVEDSDTWPYLLGRKLGCDVDNLGASGFGIDQSVLHYQALSRHDAFVIFGITSVMFTADAAASWTFYSKAVDNLPLPALTKPRFLLEGDALILKPRPPSLRSAIAEYHDDDIFRREWTPLQFPFSWHIARAVYQRAFIPRLSDDNVMNQRETSKAMRKLGWRILQTYRGSAQPVVFMIPSPDEVEIKPDIIAEARSALPSMCLVDPSPALTHLAAEIGTVRMRTRTGHFSPEGNAVLAEELAAGLARCGIHP
ncbi:hypothetical protein JQ604_17000 [Bradyrhizobium jicamae]|uniref:hypothetical protein n=1 Tax=Bradyrhizobium jicamae TaxID=280332 RepID=UPI001BA90E20|nr:hypothetical protein [Bradyrhizobium jicamae]MBR0753884.1 hypothetical protein [Bradyrhizobium jicamae]